MGTVWDEIYKKNELLECSPHPEIANIAALFTKHGVRRILDLGSGGGRHTVYLAQRGFDVHGLDSSPTGLAHTLTSLANRSLTAHVTLHDMASLPYDDSYFDAIISVQVIHHNRLEGIRETVAEITRVLKPAGLVWITMPVSKNEPSKQQREIEPGTYVPLDGSEKGLPHHYFRREEIPSLFADYAVLDLHVDDTNHHSFTGMKKGMA